VSLDRLVDLHVHSLASGGPELPDLIEAADRRGIRIGVADHVGTDSALSTEPRIHEHLDEMADFPVLRSLELELGEAFRLSRAVQRRLDYLVGGLHAVRVGAHTISMADPDRPEAAPEEIVQAIVDRLCEAIEEEPIDLLAHPTLLPRALRPQADRLFHDGHLDRIGRVAAEQGVALELSGRLRLPHERAAERWLAAGARLALGSGAYAAAEVGELGWPLDLLSRLGIEPDRLFRGRN
jgi:histidinol phosphatase-like PHP family hydrolase